MDEKKGTGEGWAERVVGNVQHLRVLRELVGRREGIHVRGLARALEERLGEEAPAATTVSRVVRALEADGIVRTERRLGHKMVRLNRRSLAVFSVIEPLLEFDGAGKGAPEEQEREILSRTLADGEISFLGRDADGIIWTIPKGRRIPRETRENILDLLGIDETRYKEVDFIEASREIPAETRARWREGTGALLGYPPAS